MTTPRAFIHVLIFLCLLSGAFIPFALPASAQQPPPPGQATAQTISLGPATYVTVKMYRTLPQLSPDEIQRREAEMAQHPLPGPQLPVGELRSGPFDPARDSSTQAQPVTPQPSAAIQQPQAISPSPFTVFRNTFLSDEVTHAGGDQASEIGSPSGVAKGYLVFQTGNWFAALSTDGGNIFSYIDPATAFASTYGDHFFNQLAIFDPSRDIFIWVIPYDPVNNQGAIRLAVARSDQIARGIWHYWDILADSGFKWDAIDLALSNSYAWISVSKYSLGGTFSQASVYRFTLDSLRAGGSLSADKYPTSNFAPRLAQGATDTMHFASHNSTSQIRIFHWPENSNAVSFTDVDIPTWNDASRICPAPDSKNWCGRSDGRVQTGWIAKNSIAFMWNASQGGSFQQPYIEAVRLSATDYTILPGSHGRPVIYTNSDAFQYPSAAVNARGDVGLGFYHSSALDYPSVAAALFDDMSGIPPGWQYSFIQGGSFSPTQAGGKTSAVGDYLTVRPYAPTALTWTLAGYILKDCSYCANPFYAIFGRERDRGSVESSWLPPYRQWFFLPVVRNQ